MRTRISGEPAVARNLRGHESPSPEPPWNRSCVAAKVVYKVVTIDYFLEIPHVIIQLWTYSSGLSLRVSLISARSPPPPCLYRNPLSGWSTLPRSFDLRNRGVRPPSCRLPVDLGCFSRPLFAFQSFEDALRLSSRLPDFR